MSHQHNDTGQGTTAGTGRLKLVLAVILVIMVAEFVGGIISNSLALLGDAGHMLVDGLAISLSLFAITMAARPATASKTYGYHRVEIMAALANGILLALMAAYIFYEAFQRFQDPPEVQAPLMLIIASIGLVANTIGILVLKGANRNNLNIKAAFWHILGDTISSVGVIVGGIIIAITGQGIVDPIIAVFIGVIILIGAVRLVREAGDILLEAVPKHIPVDTVIGILKGVPGVEEVHDVHIWTITSGIHALSAHLIIEDRSVSEAGQIVELVNRELNSQFSISHTTLQLECEKCESCPSGIICNISRPE